MTDELYEQYKNDKDFKHYVDQWAKNHNMSIFEVFSFNILKEYARYCKEKEADKI